MQAHPAQPSASAGAPPPSVTGALRAVEAFLLRGGQRTARRNAWTAVLADRERARDRHEAQHVLETLGTGPAPLSAVLGSSLAVVRNPGPGER